MIGDHTPVPTLGVRDIGSAREFYEGTLGLTPGRDMPGGVEYRAGSGGIFVYESEFAGTNKATAMMFELPEDAFDTQVADLRAKGVAFQTYDLPETQWDDGVATMMDGGFRSVWFEDPDGNIFNLGTGMG
ncbi:VOC family protein [Knoellia aerolata]|uniref:Glyoxalase n=1 Tax=Knoellia aerolata DSM 18566 TaxID=1385519 RepID=A0A0A0JXH9_9MICO|nr:VOC family protein [Knoellia aerolata]KGN41414.1 glyoxalase [Knoellia aerolata DSM 18566]